MLKKLAVTSIVVMAHVHPVFAGELDDAMAAYNAGKYATAREILEPLASRGEVQAQIAIGGLYADGLGVEQSYSQAMTWFRRAADQGSARAMYNIGSLHYNGQG